MIRWPVSVRKVEPKAWDARTTTESLVDIQSLQPLRVVEHVLSELWRRIDIRLELLQALRWQSIGCAATGAATSQERSPRTYSRSRHTGNRTRRTRNRLLIRSVADWPSATGIRTGPKFCGYSRDDGVIWLSHRRVSQPDADKVVFAHDGLRLSSGQACPATQDIRTRAASTSDPGAANLDAKCD